MDDLVGWVHEKHAGQLVKKTRLPYFEHLEFVARLAAKYTPLGYEVGLCHDLLEKTNTTPEELQAALERLGYADFKTITEQVVELTDEYTKAAFPDLSKAKRKAMEEERLLHISPGAQFVKYADFVYNLSWMKRFKPRKAAAYQKRKMRLLSRMCTVAYLAENLLYLNGETAD